MRYSILFTLILAICELLPAQQPKADQSKEVDQDSMSARIDQIIDNKLRSEGWASAEDCDDSSFIRRAYLDLTGIPPKATEVLEFIEDKAVDKRKSLIAKLVAAPSHAENLAAIWSSWLTPERADMPIFGRGQNGLQTWLRNRFAENLRYDRLVADMLVSSGSVEAGPTSFFVALESKPEKIAAQTARVFMGVQLDCAECHDHPFDQWKQRDFWGFAAYFAQISSNDEMGMGNGDITDTNKGEVSLPNSEETIAPKPLVETQAVNSRGTRRQQLTLWLTTRDNPFLARATVNRVWAMLMGRGLIEPIDDMRANQVASHPELLDELSNYFASNNYDLRKLIVVIANSRAYSRGTRHTSGHAPDDLYAVMLTKPLSERQLASSVGEVARQLGEQSQNLQQSLSQQLGKLRGEASQSKLGIVNALVTLHGDILNQATSEQTSRLLKALQAPHLDQRGQIRWLYLASLCRLPTQSEEQFLSGELDEFERTIAAKQKESSNESSSNESNSAASGDEVNSLRKQEILKWQSDLLWALLNSSEFAMTP
jgi:Protein of unknown function (DUF1549)/Protein of unknown function (DUF1553)